MTRRITLILILVISCISIETLTAQSNCSYDASRGLWVDAEGKRCANSIFTAVPFLRLTPDARSSGLGDAGVALSPDANSARYNASTTAFDRRGFAVAVNYSPWLSGIVEDVNIASITGSYKWDDIQAISFDFLYFDYGVINFTGQNGESLGTGYPAEFAAGINYARKLSEKFALSAGAKYIYSNLASGQNINSVEIQTGNAFAVDIGMRYQQPISNNQSLNFGLAFTNIGSKISYLENSEVGDFIPMNMGLGAAYTYEIDEYNSISFIAETNKLLVPSPPIDLEDPDIDSDNNGILDYREQGPIEAIFSSFGDSDNGFKGELSEFNFSLGAEYWYDQLLALRLGYFHESQFKGNRQYFTAGLGLNYSFFGLNFSYLLPVSAVRSPLDNTLKFSLILDLKNPNEEVN